jgi:tripartite-type tricarboxylate transporter receptor subunit TctC
MRLLVVFAEERIPEFPDVPTAKDLGLNVGIKGPLGVVGPKSLPPNIVKILAEGFKKATEDPKFINFMANVMHTPIVYKGPEEYLKEARE